MGKDNMFYELDKAMIEYREACNDPNTQEYKDKMVAEEIFSKPFHFGA